MSAIGQLEISTPRWFLPFLEPAPFKGAHGGRSSGKSHQFAELLVEDHIRDPHLSSVCIREVQKSLKFSAKRLLESKIRRMGVEHYFDAKGGEIRDRRGDGIIIFQGMQDHTADSIKSLEGFKRAWVEEAQNLSARSLELLEPTIRADDAEIWFTWNPVNPEDAVDQFMRKNPPKGAVVAEVNYMDNPFLPQRSRDSAERMMKSDDEAYTHVWLGGYLRFSDAQVLRGKWRIDEFEPTPDWDGPYQGLDFGFSQDPTAGTRWWIHENRLFLEYEAGRTELELDDTADFLTREIPDFDKYITRADNARPESISYLKRNGLPMLRAVDKWPGSIEDGISFLRSFEEIVIHTRCKESQTEARLYSHKVNKAGDVLPDIVDKHNHYIDSGRYALAPLIQNRRPADMSSGVILGPTLESAEIDF